MNPINDPTSSQYRPRSAHAPLCTCVACMTAPNLCDDCGDECGEAVLCADCIEAGQ